MNPILIIVVAVLAWVLVRVSLQLVSRRKGKVQVTYSEAAQEKEQLRLAKEKAKRKANTALQMFIAQTGRVAQKQKITMLMPGALDVQGETTRLTMVLAGPGGLLGIKSLSFAGEVQGHMSAPWSRTENGETTTFANPVEGCAQDAALLRKLLDDNGMANVPAACVAVFVNHDVSVKAPAAAAYYTDKTLFAALENGELMPDAGCDTAALMALLQKSLKQEG